MKPTIEVRYAKLDNGEQEFDEIVARDAVVHLEKMDTNWFCLILEINGERACFNIGSKRAPVNASEMWREPINRRAEAQRRRWNRLTGAQRKRKRKSY